MRSHSVTCHPTEVRIPPLSPTEASTLFSDPRGMQGWVELCYVKADRPGIEPATCKSQVQRPTAEPPCNMTQHVLIHQPCDISNRTNIRLAHLHKKSHALLAEVKYTICLQYMSAPLWSYSFLGVKASINCSVADTVIMKGSRKYLDWACVMYVLMQGQNETVLIQSSIASQASEHDRNVTDNDNSELKLKFYLHFTLLVFTTNQWR